MEEIPGETERVGGPDGWQEGEVETKTKTEVWKGKEN
jgi:hypothetical protein